ncbi:tetratricopeptide repeat protein [Dyella acidisoli]|uniref:Sel1 repeat family protein n=1 Tax=Dyella acidisoli TaxID=1867834 RepID=A0ABQ5XLE1_9GAMM|nr:hypothetical protein [Dyella acidisoli]GLQ92516.1 hypothetical protein GCM10007901_14670 [Dyella acidisoli]
MKALRRAIICSVVLGFGPSITFASDGNNAPALSDKQMQHMLESMSANSTEGHPDLHGQFGGLLRYEKGDYAGAMKYFLSGARYADKVSQLNIGLMYFNGQGVAKDPATAYAWVALSAERNYPQFVATRDSLWAQLDPQQREKANEILKQLTTEYGDAVAKRRLMAIFQQEKLHMTGSPAGVGGDLAAGTLAQFSNSLGSSGSTPRNLVIPPTTGATGLDSGGQFPRCDLSPIEGGAITGCGDYWADNRWNSSMYFKAADSFWKAAVKVGPLENVSNSSLLLTPSTPPASSTDQSQGDAHPQ